MPGWTEILKLRARRPRRIVRRVLHGVAALLMSLPAQAVGENSQPTLELIPTSIATATIERPESMQARLRLRAPTGATLRDLRLTSFSNDAVMVAIEGGPDAAGVTSLAPNDEHSWTVRLTAARPLAKKAQVVFEVAFTLEPTERKPDDETAPEEVQASVQRHLSAILEIEPPATEVLTSLVTLEIKGDEAVVSRQRPSTLYMVLKNQRDLAVEVTDIRWFGPGFIVLREGSESCTADDASPGPVTSRSLAPYEQAVLPILVCPEEQIVPGKYNLLASANVTLDGTVLAALSVSQAVEVGVLGESDLLNLLGVPSLLLLPGFLFLITLRLLQVSLVAPVEGAALKPKEADFWAVAIALSIAFAFLYPWATEQLVPEGRRDYLIAYGLRDLVYVYAAAIILGCLVFFVWRILLWCASLYRAAQLRRCLPQAGDDPAAILQKLVLAKSDFTLELPAVHIKGTAAAEHLLLLSPWSTAETLWVTPPAQLEIRDHFEDPEDGRLANNALQRLIEAEDVDAATAGQILKDGQTKAWWTVEWAQIGTVVGPVAVAPDNVERLQQRERLLREAP